MANKDIALMAHLMRRAGFGATYDELEARAARATKPPWKSWWTPTPTVCRSTTS